MTSVYNYLVGSLPFRKSSNANGAETGVNGNSTEAGSKNQNGKEATESTSLLHNNNNNLDNETPHSAETSSSTFAATSSDHHIQKSNDNGELKPLNDDVANASNGLSVQTHQQQDDNDVTIIDTENDDPLQQRPPTVNEYYFTPDNPTVQRYYRFTSTPLTPIAALHKRPSGPTTPHTADPASSGGVTGLLRRSAVVPSHGTDATGQWILVSVGGRSGWARKKSSQNQYAGFTPAESFRATEGWMGNHAFLFQGKRFAGLAVFLGGFTLCLLEKVRR